jgi:predicted protein tyrosine phosphatase
MKVLFVCTSNKDRSPALEKYLQEKYPDHEFKSAGVNKYFCGQKGTTYLTDELLSDAELLVCAESIHAEIIARDFHKVHLRNTMILRLNLGEYEQGNINQDYLERANALVGMFLQQNKTSE